MNTYVTAKAGRLNITYSRCTRALPATDENEEFCNEVCLNLLRSGYCAIVRRENGHIATYREKSFKAKLQSVIKDWIPEHHYRRLFMWAEEGEQRIHVQNRRAYNRARPGTCDYAVYVEREAMYCRLCHSLYYRSMEGWTYRRRGGVFYRQGRSRHGQCCGNCLSRLREALNEQEEKFLHARAGLVPLEHGYQRVNFR